MKILYNNRLQEIKNIIQTKACYQKVMIIYDDTVSNHELQDIYNEIKEYCIYNQTSSLSVDEQEIYNGYRAIIYLCSVDSFLKLNFNKEEFINIFCASKRELLPYFLNQDNKVVLNENYLLLDDSHVDANMLVSIYFNQFYNYLFNLVNMTNLNFDFSYRLNEVTQFNVMQLIESADKDFMFLDVEILKKTNLEYKDIALIDLMLIDAFLLLIVSIKQQNFMLVDVYKSAKDDDLMIEKYYRLYNNDVFRNIVMLNYNCLYNYCLKTKQKICEMLSMLEVDKSKVDFVFSQLKNYTKQSDNLTSYLYLFNVFNV